MIYSETEVTTAINKFNRSLFKKGHWQIMMFLLIEQSVQYTGAFIILSSTFTSGKMNFQCDMKDKDKEIYAPIDECVMFNKKQNKTVNCLSYTFSPKEEFVYSSVVKDFQLICHNQMLDGLPQSMIMVGLFVGGFVGPILADKFGRRIVVFGSFFVAGIVGISSSFVTNFPLFVSLNFVLGIVRESSMSVGFIFGLEFIPDTHQSMYGMLSQVIWSLNIILLGIMAYFIRYWRTLQLVGSVPILIFSILIIVVPESPRWLITMARFETMRNLIDNFVNKVNKRKTSSLNNIERLKSAYMQHRKRAMGRRDSTQYSGLDIFKSSFLRLWSLILTLSWTFMVIAYFSMTMLTVHVPGNKYFHFILPVCLEIPGYFLAFFLVQKSRNLTYLFAQIISSICFITVGFLSNHKFIVALIIIGKCGLAASFYVTVISAIYIFPTTMRSFGTSMPSAISKLLATFLPYFVKLHMVYSWLPTFLIGAGAAFIGLINLLYPDWVNRPIPETMREVEFLKHRIGFNIKCKSDDANENSNEDTSQNETL